jgi:hypothetical protein
MNLQEQIYRINEMMGIIVEDNKSRLLDIIDREGFYTIMKFVGGSLNLNNANVESLGNLESVGVICIEGNTI